jgi:hypothetical protein
LDLLEAEEEDLGLWEVELCLKLDLLEVMEVMEVLEVMEVMEVMESCLCSNIHDILMVSSLFNSFPFVFALSWFYRSSL